MRRITQFFLTLLFIMVGVNVVQAQTTKTLSLDFTKATPVSVNKNGQDVTVSGTTVTLGTYESITANDGLVTGNNLAISKGVLKGGVKFSLSGVKANTKVSIVVTFSGTNTSNATFRYAVVEKGTTSVSISSKAVSPKTVDLSTAAPDATDLDFYVGRDNSTYRYISKIEVTYTPADGTTTTTYAPSYSTIDDQTMTVGDEDLDIPSFTVTANNVDVTDYLTFSYSSSDTKVVTIDNYMLHAVAAGTATITVSNAAYGTTEAGSTTFKVTVSDETTPTVDEVTLEAKPAAATISTGETTTIATTASDPDGYDITSQLTFTYSIDASSTATDASVDDKGKVTAGSTKGTVVVNVSSAAVTDKYAAATTQVVITVTDGTKPTASFLGGDKVANRQIVYLDLKDFPARTGYVKNDAYVIEYNFKEYPSKINTTHKSSGRENADYYEATGKNDSGTKNFLYLRGIPIIASTANTGNDEQKTVYVTIWKMTQAADGTYDGEVVQNLDKTFTITSMPTPPAAPTLNPAGATSSKGTKPTLTTDDPVNVIGGADANRVWGKFSKKVTYSEDEILNAANSFGNYTPTATVFSTKTGPRVISGYSIVVDENGANRISQMAAGWYNYISPRKPTRVIFYDDATPAIVVNTVTVNGSALTTFKEPTPKASYNAGADEKGNITWTEYETTFVNYTSSNTDVATVDATTGKVTLTGNPGTTQISVSTTQTDSYAVGTGSYDITVINDKKIAAPTITPGTRNYSQPFTSVVKGDGENPFVYTVTVNGTKVETEDGGTITDGSEAQYDVAIPDNTTADNVVVITAYAYDKDDATKKSNEVSVTYTYKFVSVPKPVLTPPGLKEDGSDKDALSYKYTYNTSDENYVDGKYLEVTASYADSVPEGTKIYYTVNSSTDNVTDQDIAYDGQAHIHVIGSQIIRAIAIDGEGNRSPIVTYQYNFDDGLQAPVFYVNGKKVAIGTGDNLYDQSKITKDGDALKVEVYTTDKITIVGPDEGSADHDVTVHFTVDGSHPTHNSTKTATDGTQLVASTTAIAIEYCATHSAVSDETIVEFIVTEEDNSNRIWKADEETSPKGILGGSGSNASGYIVSTNENHKGAKQANKDPEAIHDITITFGGMVPSAGPGKGKTSWANFKASAPNSGANIDGVGKYQLNTKADALDENGDLYNHESEVLDKNYERYYKVPAIGSFIKLEPEKDGVVTIYAFQHGGVHYEDGISTKDNFSPAFITVKPVYMIDEVGQSLPAQNIVSNGTLDDNWFKYDPATTFVGVGSTKDGKTEHYYSVEQKKQMYQMYQAYLNSLNDDTPKGIGIAPFNIFSNSYKDFVAGADADHQAVGTCSTGYGYATISPASVAYTYNVKAGKTYFFFAWRTKIGIRGIRFVPDKGYATVTREFKDADDNTSAISEAVTADAQYGHGSTWHFDRKFAKDTWAGVVFPFSVSSTKLQQVFGKGTMVSNWYDLQKSGAINYLNFRNHFHQMIPAGVPVLICPTGVAFDGSTINFANGVTFENVTTETSTVTDEVSPDGKLKMTGSFDNTHSTPQYGWYIQKGKLVQRIAKTPVSQKAGRSWLEGFDTEVKAKVGYTFFTGEDDNETNGIVEINTDDVNGNGTQYEDGVVYDLQGQLITRDSERLGDGSLPKGVYILNGKKYVVK